MATYLAQLKWTLGSHGFGIKEYSRSHTITFGGGQVVAASSAPEYLGDASKLNPEEALAASLASCHMLTFLALCSSKGFVVEEYTDHAEAELGKNQEGKMAVVLITLKPKVRFRGAQPDLEACRALHEKAHGACFIANALKCSMKIDV